MAFEYLAMTFLGLESIFPGYPGFVPGALVAIAISFAANGLVGRALSILRDLAAAFIVCLGLILSATLTVGREGLAYAVNGTVSCDLTRLGAATLAELSAANETTLNILLFVPFGVVCGLIPRSPLKASILAAAFAMPFAIETVQLLMSAMNRTCQSADVIDNLAGLAAGLTLGTVARLLRDNRGDWFGSRH